ncbi:MAG TPA: hypothetical protein VMW27_05885 [Thermoanaerobaculia bacterium]|nr:hypothetical protein [Thermoanaerobaculia bacterium]
MNHLRPRPLPSRRVFFAHLAANAVRGVLILGVALGIGVLGYHFVVGLPWLDALLNAAMLLGGEGPLAPTPTAAGKLFASFYALFSGLVFVTIAGLVLAPAMHRLLHRFHLEASLPDEESPAQTQTRLTTPSPDDQKRPSDPSR